MTLPAPNQLTDRPRALPKPEPTEPELKRPQTPRHLREMIARAYEKCGWRHDSFFQWFEEWVGTHDLCDFDKDPEKDPWPALDDIALDTWRIELESDPAIGPFAGRE